MKMEECVTVEDDMKFHGTCKSRNGEFFEFIAKTKDVAEKTAKSIQTGDLKVLTYKRPETGSEESDLIRIYIKQVK